MFRLTIFLIVFSCTVPRQKNISKKNIDSIINKIRGDVQLSLDERDFDSGLKYLDSIYTEVIQIHNDSLTSAWMRYKGAVFMFRGQFDSADFFLRKAYSVALHLKSPNRQLLGIKTLMMNSFARQNRFDSALIFGLDAYQTAQHLDPGALGSISTILSEVYMRMGDTANRRRYLFEGYDQVTDAKMKLTLANNIAKYYFDIGKEDSAIAFHNKVKAAASFSNHYYYQSVNTANIGMLLTMKGNLKKGLGYLLESADLNNRYNMVDENLYLNIAANYAKQKNFLKSDLYADSARRIAKKKNNYLSISNAFGQLSDNKLAQKKFEEAYDDLDSSYDYHSKNDSVSFIKTAQELEDRYAAKAKDEKISSLAFENKVNKKIAYQQRLIIVTILLALLFLILAGVLLWRRRQFQVKLREAELQQQLLTIQMEPHFLFNMLATLQSYLRSGDQRAKVLHYFERLSLLMRLVLQNARKTFVPLESEIAIIGCYLDLQVMQSDNSFTYRIDTYPAYKDDDILVPSMLLQPFVENAVLYAFKNINYEGHLAVQISRNNDRLQYIIDDNGKGFGEQKTSEIKRLHAIDITRERLALLNRKTGGRAKLEIIDKDTIAEGSGTRVCLEVPFL